MDDKKEKHFEGEIHQNAVVTTKSGNNVLVVRDERDELWQLPGGRLNLGEGSIEGLKRELFEELGIDVEVGPIYYTGQMLHVMSGRTNFLVMYEVFVDSEETTFDLSKDQIAEVQWVDKDSYKNIPLFDDVKEALDAYFERYEN